VELQLLLLGAENTFIPTCYCTSYRATWATQRLSLLAAGLLQTTERACWWGALSRPGLAWPAGDPPPFIHTVHTYCPRTAV